MMMMMMMMKGGPTLLYALMRTFLRWNTDENNAGNSADWHEAEGIAVEWWVNWW